MTWAPGGQYLLLMGWDGKVRVLEAEGWRCLALIAAGSGKRLGKDVVRTSSTSEKRAGLMIQTIWREPDGWIRDTKGRGIVQCELGRRSHRETYKLTTLVDKIPHSSQIPSSSATASPMFSATSPVQLLISPSGRHFGFIPPTNLSIIHIYSLLPSPTSLPDIKHKAAIIFSRIVRSMEWAGGGKERLAIFCKSSGKAGRPEGEGGAVYIWDEEGWEDEVAEDRDTENGGGVMEGVGIPNGVSFLLSSVLC